MRYLIYCRRSSDREDRQTLSLDAQRRELERVVANDPSVSVVDVLVESQSAYKPGRPVFEEMLERIELGEADAILTWQANRLARNSLDGGRLVYMMDQGKLKEIRTMSKTYSGTGNDKFFLQIEFGMAKKSSDDTSDYMKRDAKSKLLKGEWPGMTPIGYLNIDADGKIAGKFYDHEKQTQLHRLGRPLKRVEKDPLVAPHIRQFFDEYLHGDKSLQDMANFLNNAGVKSPRYKGKYTCSMVDRILKNPFFCGKMLYEGELYDGVHEAIITLREHEWILSRTTEKTRPKLVKQEFVYRGLIKCGQCGCAIVGARKTKPSGKQYVYYGCSKRRGPCQQPTIKPEQLDQQVEERIKAVFIDERIWSLCKKLLALSSKEQIDQQLLLRAKWQKDLVLTENKLHRLLDMHLSGEIDKPAYAEKKSQLLKEKALLMEKLADSGSSTDQHRKKVESFFEVAHLAHRTFQEGTIMQKKGIVKHIGWNLQLIDGKLRWEYKKPFNFLVERQNPAVAVGTQQPRVFTNKNTPANAEALFWRTGRESNPRSSP